MEWINYLLYFYSDYKGLFKETPKLTSLKFKWHQFYFALQTTVHDSNH